MFCVIFEPTSAKEIAKTPKNLFSLFKPDETTFAKKNRVPGSNSDEKFQSFTFPSFIYAEGVLVVFAQAEKTAEKSKSCDIVEGYVELNNVGGEWTNKVAGESAQTFWTRYIFTKKNKKINCAGNPTAVFNNENVYMFFGCADNGRGKSDYDVVSGQIITDDKKYIKWDFPAGIKNKLKLTTEDSGNANFFASGGSGITINNSIVVPVLYERKDKKFISTIITNSTNEADENWELVLKKSSVEGKYPAIVDWGGRLIMMTVNKDGSYKFYESNDTGDEWTDASGSLSGVWGKTQESARIDYGGKSGFITAEIEPERKEKVMLFTQLVKKGEEENYNLHLLMTDYQRVYDVGEISDKVEQKTSSTLLYAERSLFAAYEKWESYKSTILVTHLKEESDEVKKILNRWTEQDKELSESCFADDLTITKSTQCIKNIPTKGLVRFLSNNYSDGKWADEYRCVSAIVKEAQKVTKIDNSLKLTGPGAGATWPVNKQGQNQLYHFVNYAFTLVATIKIDSNANENGNSVMGIDLGESNDKKNIGLWCTKNSEWAVGEQKNFKKPTTAEKCDKGKFYQVAFTLKDKRVSVYINGNKLEELPEGTISVQQKGKITHFYFGVNTEGAAAGAAVGSHVSVKNVFLYNRPFTAKEMRELKESVQLAKSAENADGSKNTTGNIDKSTSTQPSTNEKEKVPSPSRTEDGGVGGGVRVFSLLLAVLCVSAPLLHL